MELIKELKAKTEARIEENLEAKSWTWLATGGSPLFTFFPSSIKDIQTFLKIKEKNMLFRTFGAASNILIRDNKFNGVFIRLMKGFRSFEVENDKIIVSAGLPSSLIVNQAIKANLGNIEFLATIPGMLGGMIKMNAGAHEQEIGEAIEWVEFLDETGALNRINNKECLFTYRNSIFKPNWIILKACIKCKKQDQEKS